MAIGHTDDATSGFGTFGLPNQFYGGVVGNFSSLVAIGTTGNNYSLNINQGRYDDILVPCRVVDDKIVDDYLEPINVKKQSIQQLGHSGTWIGFPTTFNTSGEALSAISPLYQDSHTSNDNQACSVLGFTSYVGGVNVTAGQVVSQLIDDTVDPILYATGVVSISTTGGSVVVQDVVGTFDLIGAGSSTGVGNVTIGGVDYERPGTLKYTGLTKIREDVTMVTKYPNLEPADSSADNPWAGDTYPLLDNSTNGVGYAQTFFKNAIDTGAGGNPTIGAAQDYGKVYTFNLTAASSLVSQIDTLDSEVVTLRSGMVSYTATSNVLKPIKIGYAVNIWSYERGNAIVVADNNKFKQAIDILSDPNIGGPY